VLAAAGLHPKDTWGQNFLGDDGVLARIAAAARLAPGDVCVELGAGLGHLTAALAATGARVVAVERDRELAAVLRERAPAGVAVVEANAVALDVAALAGGPAVVVGNLPYHLTSPILFALLEQRAAVRRAVFTLQREVAVRLAAPPGGRDVGILSVLLGREFTIEHLFDLAPDLFYPPPKVTSAVVRLERRAAPLAEVRDPARFKRLVKAAFGQRRKTLANALRGGQTPDFRFDVDAVLAAAGIDGHRRAETLTIGEFARLERALDA
jgi:16S rRNA (adenine1518-N6/adenine1519-N6)-dimethyltransferase